MIKLGSAGAYHIGMVVASKSLKTIGSCVLGNTILEFIASSALIETIWSESQIGSEVPKWGTALLEK